MSTDAIVITTIVVLCLAVLVGGAFYWVRRLASGALAQAKDLARGKILGTDPMASFVARTDRGLKQLQGNAALVLSEKTLVSVRWVPRERTVIERGHVKGARLVNQFGTRWLPGKPRILVLDIKRPKEEFQIGFMPRDAAQWHTAIEAWRAGKY